MTRIAAINPARHTNADLILACAELGYLRTDMRVLDATYGYGAFWSKWRPTDLWTNDLHPRKGNDHFDFRSFPEAWRDCPFDAVVFDPPYKLNGTGDTTDGGMDERFGVDDNMKWQERMHLCRDGIAGCLDVLAPKGALLVKCQAQVCSGAVRWQDRDFSDHAEKLGCKLVDRMDLLGGRQQPEGRRQVHFDRNHSTLLIFVGPK